MFLVPEAYVDVHVSYMFQYLLTWNLRQGGPKMKASAAYPRGYAKRLFKLHKPFMVRWVFSRDSALRLVDDAKRFFFDTKVFGGLDIDMIYFSLRAACFQ